jgi:hypothetical protein
MNHIDKVNAIQFIRPNAQFVLIGDDINWLDEKQTEPTNAEIKAGLIAYNLATEAEAQAKATAKAALLDRLGITAEEAVLLLS